MADNKEKDSKKQIKDVIDLSRSFDTGFDELYAYVGSVSNGKEIDSIQRQVDIIIRDEIQNTQSVTSDEMSQYLVKLFNDSESSNNLKINSINDIFSGSGNNEIASFFQQRYQNRNMLYDDLNMLCTQLAELQEAVLTTRDAVITSDDISSIVSRTIKFEGVNETGDVSVDSFVETVKNIEERFELPKKIKNQIVTNTLKYGTSYVYHIPYSKLFEEQYARKIADPTKYGTTIQESLCEASTISSLKTDLNNLDASYKITDVNLNKTVSNYGSNIAVTNDICSIPLLEGTDAIKAFSSNEWEKLYKKNDEWKKAHKGYTANDGVVDINAEVKGKFDSVSGVYIRYIEPRKLVPIKILDTTLGYYYIHENKMVTSQSPFSQTIKVSNNTNQVNSYNENIENTFLSVITDKIIDKFDPKYVENNQKFKELIMNALQYNDIYKNALNFQFIPAEYITEFTIDEDENGEGQSILIKSLFYGKLYLALLIFKLITILTRSNDTRVYYIKNSGIDTNIVNQIQDVARSIKAKQISFLDLLNYNSIISSVGQYKDVFMPVGRSGDRSIEFDTIAGQNVDLNSEMIEFLRTNMINNTGVPSVIMNYVNEAD